jgi:hypothetical protein
MTVSEQQKSEWSSASILPFCTQDGELNILIGRETTGFQNDTGNWDTFGGGREDADSTPRDTAIREFVEETMGVFGDRELISRNLLRHHIRIHSNGHRIYLLPLTYNASIIETYNRILHHMQPCFRVRHLKPRQGSDNAASIASLYIPTCPTGLLEKTMLEWCPAESLLQKQEILRPHTARVLEPVVKQLRELLRS